VDLASRLFCGTVSGYALPFCFDLWFCLGKTRLFF
jgi:hypothetical protein